MKGIHATWIRIGLFGTVAAVVTASPAVAQGTPDRVPSTLVPPQAVVVAADANGVRAELQTMLRKYPPTLARILYMDPTLLANDAYLAPYPELRAFLGQHPEVQRSPAYFLSFARQPEPTPATPEQLAWNQTRNLLEMVGVALLFAGAALIVLWLVRHLLAHRRWLRATRLQNDFQNRILERLASSEDVRAYVQSAAAVRPIADATLAGDRTSTPFGRVLFAVQAGIVLCSGGIGVLLVKRIIGATGPGADVLVFFGVLTLMLGLGFALAAFASFVLSRRFGLLPTNPGSTRALGEERV